MAAASPNLSVADLERILEERRVRLEQLIARRDELQQELDSIDADMQAVVSVGGLAGKRGRRRRTRVKNEVPLRTVVLDILKKSKKGFPLPDLADKVLASGYKSGSRNFRNVLYQCLYNTKGVVHDEATGCYRLER